MSTIQDLLNFTSFTHAFQKVKRTMFAVGEERHESVVEHCFQLALVAWFLIETENLQLDKEKVLKYALAHDLVETYAGDLHFYNRSEDADKLKKINEEKAAERIKKEFPSFDEVSKCIEGYKSLTDKEAKFVYALDKILPVINNYLDNGRSWKKDKVTLEMVRTKDEKIAVSEELQSVWKELAALVEKKQDQLFPSHELS